MSVAPAPPALGFAGASDETVLELVCETLPILQRHGLRAAVVTGAGDGYDPDRPGKDSFELRKAGADETLLASRYGWALVVETVSPSQPDPAALIQRLDWRLLDVVLVIGFDDADLPRIVLGTSEGAGDDDPGAPRPADCRALAERILDLAGRAREPSGTR